MLASMVRAASSKSAVPKPAGERPPRARLELDERRAQLIALGLSLFSERSYDDVSIDDLAHAAGISKGLLYHYFPTKRHLYVAALRFAAQQLLDETLPDAAAPPEERARRGIETYLDFVERHGTVYVALMRGGVGSDPEVAGILEETRRTIAARIVDDLPAELPRPLVSTILRGWIGFVEATAIDWVANRPVPREQLVTLLSALMFDVIQRVASVTQTPPA
jgi:AcrR family transcriptional regulator